MVDSTTGTVKANRNVLLCELTELRCPTCKLALAHVTYLRTHGLHCRPCKVLYSRILRYEPVDKEDFDSAWRQQVHIGKIWISDIPRRVFRKRRDAGDRAA
jgi:hypothetical protein